MSQNALYHTAVLHSRFRSFSIGIDAARVVIPDRILRTWNDSAVLDGLDSRIGIPAVSGHAAHYLALLHV